MVEELLKADYALPKKAWNGIFIVGEAPGLDEIHQNQPFVGRSGQLLDKALAQAGIERKACFVGNVFRFRPPKNNVGFFFASKREIEASGELLFVEAGRCAGKYCRIDYAAELDFLHENVTVARPRALLAVGKTALWALTGEDRITELAGKQLPCRFAPDIPVVVAYHPSYILRGNWHLFDSWAQHMTAARALANGERR